MRKTRNTAIAGRAPRVHRAWWVVAIAGLAIISAGAFSTMPGLLVGPLHHEFDWSRGSIGFAVWVNMAAGGLVAPFAAAMMDRFGIRRVAAGALTIIAGGAALTAVMNQSWQLTLYWGVLIGLGCGLVDEEPFAATVANRWFSERRGLVTGILTAASVLGQFALLPMFSAIIDRSEWRAAVVTVALVALAPRRTGSCGCTSRPPHTTWHAGHGGGAAGHDRDLQRRRHDRLGLAHRPL
ncbi:MAG: MFS transporter [Haloechinothrix sp.]